MSIKINMSDRVAAARLLRRHGEHDYAARVESGHADDSYEVQAMAEHREDWWEDTAAETAFPAAEGEEGATNDNRDGAQEQAVAAE